jgi:transposase-like protein
MLQRVSETASQSTEIGRTAVRPPEKKFACVARALWPHKTAAELAARAGVSQRTAEFWLAGREPSAAALVAIINEIAEIE